MRNLIEINSSPLQLLKINVLNKELHVTLNEVDIGFATKHALIKSSENLPGNQLLSIQFRKDCLTFLSTTAKNLLKKCSLNYVAIGQLR